MPRPLRRVATALTALSLTLCLATLAAWARSYWYSDQVPMARAGHLLRLSSSTGVLEVTWVTHWLGNRNINPHLATQSLGRPQWSWPRLKDFGTRADTTPLVGTSHLVPERTVWFPHWPLAALTAIAPTLWLTRHHRRRARAAQGHCPACGYDLTANVSGTCPECGTKVQVPT